MSDLAQDKNVELVVTFSATSTINLNEICKELEISISDIVSLNLKYCHLYVSLKDGRELEYATSAYEAEFDTKYPDCTQTYINNVCVATNREYGNTISIEPSEPLMYVLLVRQHGVFEPIFASLRRYECEAQQALHDGVPTRIEAVLSPHGL